MTARRPHPKAGLAVVAAALLALSAASAGAQTRLPPIPPGNMTEAQKAAIEEYRTARKNPNANLAGVYMLFLRVPELMTQVSHMGAHMTASSVLPPRLTQLAILLTLREWTVQNEWNIKAPGAARIGLSPSIITAIAEGRRPEAMGEEETAVYDFCIELLRNHSVSDPTYARMLAKFGEAGVVETITIEGFYTLIGMALNTARLGTPDNSKPLPPFPQ